MTARVVPLGSADAADSLVGGTVAERLALVADLSETMWNLTRQPRPQYSRATMPVTLRPLAAGSDHGQGTNGT